jgi:hypothetical protein
VGNLSWRVYEEKASTLCLLFLFGVSTCFASILDAPQTINGRLTAGEYVSNVQVEFNEQLLIEGGAFRITTKDQSYLEVQYTSTPLSNSSGIYDIFVQNNSKLLYLGGITEEITISGNAKADIKGGRIDGITLYRRPQDSCYVTIFCQEGYQKNASGISGLWADGTSFNIQFINAGSPYPPTANYVFVELIPEPATLALLAAGGLLIHRKK